LTARKSGKKQFENTKHEDKFDKDYLPQGSAKGHGAKIVDVKGDKG